MVPLENHPLFFLLRNGYPVHKKGLLFDLAVTSFICLFSSLKSVCVVLLIQKIIPYLWP